MKIELLSISAPRKPKATKKKETKTPASIEFLIQKSKPKLRLVHKEPGRYVLKSTRGVFSILRINKEVKYVPSMRQKIFALREMESLSSDLSSEDLQAWAALDEALGAGAYSEPFEDLEAEAISFEQEFLQSKGLDLTEEELESDSAASMFGFMKFKNGVELDLEGSPDDMTKVKRAFKKGSNPVVSITDGGVSVKDANVVIGDTILDSYKEVNSYLKSMSSSHFDSMSAAPGARNKAAGAKMGRKKRAPNMLAPGWHVFELPKAGGRTKRHYVGPRISGRRLIGIAQGESAPEGAKSKTTPKSTKATEFDAKIAKGFKADLASRGVQDAKVRRSTKDGSVTVTIDKGDRTKLTGAIAALKKQMGKVEVTREMKDGKVVAVIKPAGKATKKAPEDKKQQERDALSVERLPALIKKEKARIEKLEKRFKQTGSKSTEKTLKEAKGLLKERQKLLRESKKRVSTSPAKGGSKAPAKKPAKKLASQSPKKAESKLVSKKTSRLDNPKFNKGQSYHEWKDSVVEAYGRKVKFVSYDVPSSGVSAELNGKLVDYYSL